MERVKRALISVWDKTGLRELVSELTSKGVKVYSSGGTFEFLEKEGFEAIKIEDYTGFPEVLNGRVKTLHPRVFAGILGNTRKKEHIEDLEKIGAFPFQLVVVNLYPFEDVFKRGRTESEIIEMIDIGGPSLLRAAAKNYRNVAVLCGVDQYREFIERFKAGKLDIDYRKRLAAEVFARTSYYDSVIFSFFNDGHEEKMPDIDVFFLRKRKELRYGENPDQKAAFYLRGDSGDFPFEVLHGKELSYNNYIDCLAAYELVKGLDEECCAIIKHTNPCGFAVARSQVESYLRAVKTDPVSYFGGIVAFNSEVKVETARELVKSFLECIVAPGFSNDSLEVLRKKKNLRLVIPNNVFFDFGFDIKSFGKGFLVQERQDPSDGEWKIVTRAKPGKEDMGAIKLGWHVVKHVKSNAIVLADSKGTVGIGAGQMSRVDSLKIALRKAGEAGISTEGSVMASDAFFPFRDSVDIAAKHGIKGVIQPGGSIRDEEVIKACDEYGIFMIFTGKRVFKH